MKIFFSLVWVLITLGATAQTGTEILFKRGAELEYKTMSARAKGFKMEPYEITRITLTVDNVVDSNDATYSFITKRGRGIEKPDRDFYEKKMIVVKYEDRIVLPADLYAVDTSYLADKYPAVKKAKGYTAVMKMSGKIYIRTDAEMGKLEYFPKTMEPEFIIRDVVMTTPAGAKSVTDNYESLQEYKYKIKITIGDLKFEPQMEKVKTAAGTFDCYVMRSKSVLDGMGRKFEQESLVYFHPRLGFVKTEQVDAKVKTGSLELVRLKE